MLKGATGWNPDRLSDFVQDSLPVQSGVEGFMRLQGVVLFGGMLFVVACGQASSPSRPSSVPSVGSTASSSASSTMSTSSAFGPSLAQGQRRVGFGFNGTVSGFPTGTVFLTGGGAYNRDVDFVNAAGGFRCLEAVLQGPLSTSINPSDPGQCLSGEGVRWDTAALLTSTTFKCTGAAGEALKTAVTTDTTVVLHADFYRAGDGNEESFTANMIVSDGDIAPDILGVQNLWVQGVGCGTAQAVNFSN